jgi:hypothetical protein
LRAEASGIGLLPRERIGGRRRRRRHRRRRHRHGLLLLRRRLLRRRWPWPRRRRQCDVLLRRGSMGWRGRLPLLLGGLPLLLMRLWGRRRLQWSRRWRRRSSSRCGGCGGGGGGGGDGALAVRRTVQRFCGTPSRRRPIGLDVAQIRLQVAFGVA